MSKEVARCTEALVQALLNSEEYKSYLKYQEELNQKPDLRNQIDEYRIKNFYLQNQEGVDLFDAVDQLDREYEQLRRDAFVNAYLEAELSVCRMMQNIQKTITENLSISVPEEF